MSIRHLNLAYEIQGLRPTEKFILVTLANYCDHKGVCWPSHSHIADMVGLKSTKMVQKAIKKFAELGLLIIERRKLENGGYTSNLYHLKLDRVSEYPRVVEERSQGNESTDNTKEETKEDNKTEDDKMFECFWTLYPRKVGKKTSRATFSKIKDKEKKRLIIGLQRFIQDSEKTDVKYIPHPTTWLNQERWNDYFEIDGEEVRQIKKKKNLNHLAG